MDSLIVSPWPQSWPLRVLAAVWSSLWGVVGLLGAALFRALGLGKLVARAGAVEVHAVGRLQRWFSSHRWEGFTLGWTIWYWAEPDIGDLAHERVHVAQNLRWGPLWAPAYLLSLPFTGYRNSPFERPAYAAGDKARIGNA